MAQPGRNIVLSIKTLKLDSSKLIRFFFFITPLTVQVHLINPDEQYFVSRLVSPDGHFQGSFTKRQFCRLIIVPLAWIPNDYCARGFTSSTNQQMS